MSPSRLASKKTAGFQYRGLASLQRSGSSLHLCDALERQRGPDSLRQKNKLFRSTSARLSMS